MFRELDLWMGIDQVPETLLLIAQEIMGDE
jgi:hypothetical protein